MTQVFISYAHRDLRKVQTFLDRFKPVLDAFKGTLTVWMDHQISAGSQWSREIDDAIEQSDIFLLFVTDRAIGSEYMLKTEWPKIQQAGKRRDALVIPIILEDGFWRDHFSGSQCIPHTAADRQLKPISSWKPQGDGHLAAARACRDAVVKYLKRAPKAPVGLPGPQMSATPDGLVLTTKPARKSERTDPDQLSLHGEIRDLLAALRAMLAPNPKSNAGSPRLAKAIDAYASEVDRNMDDLDPARVWTAGVDLGIAIERLLTSEDHGLGDEAIEDLERLLRRAETFSMGFEAGRKLQSRARLHRDLSPDRKATLQGSTEQVLSGMRAEPGLLTKETNAYFANVLDTMQDAYGDPNPEALASALEPAVRTGIEALVAVGKAAPRASVPADASENAAAHRKPPAKSKRRRSKPAIAPAGNLSPVISAARSFLNSSKTAVEQFAGTQSEIRRFTLGILERFGVGTYGVKVPKDYIELAEMGFEAFPEDFDYEGEAKKLILAGKALPSGWIGKITRLDFVGENEFTDLTAISNLTSLEALYIAKAKVSDLRPLSVLPALGWLSVIGTNVKDLSPLSGMTSFYGLDASDTGVTDLSPLIGLSTLKLLYVCGTRVKDLKPLSRLTALTRLFISDTEVSDLSPLSNLTALEALELRNTKIIELSPLSGLTALKELDISKTSINDLTPISGLVDLEQIDASLMKVVDFTPVANLVSLKRFSMAGRQPILLTRSLPDLEEFIILGRQLWPTNIPVPQAKYRIDADGTVHDPDGNASDWFKWWANCATDFRQTGKLPGED